MEAVKERFEFAKKWVNDFASEKYKFSLNQEITDEIRGKLSDLQKKAISLLVKKLEENDYADDKVLFEEFYSIKEETGIDIKEFFEGCYLALASKDQGPKLAPFILQIGKEKVIKLLTAASS